jgi:3-deoxy-D-manno-octulosonic-acid transferase
VAESLHPALHLYRWLTAAATPFGPLVLAQRLKKGKENKERMAERRGIATVPRPAGPLIWVHGASVGEITSVLPLIQNLRASKLPLLVTSGTVTSAQIAAQRLPKDVIHQFIPLDSPLYIRRFLDHWRPDLALLVEQDLWPNLIIEASDREVPLILLNARLSESSFERWQRIPGAIGSLLRRFDLCLARTTEDAERYRELGAPRMMITGNLKLDVPAPPADDSKLAALKAAIGDRIVIAAASTHPGEDGVMIETHIKLRANFPGLLTVIVPRHPDRGPSIVEIAASSGLKTAVRSRGQLPQSATDIYLADTMGELGLFYRLAPIVFIGGSLVKHGGQNPIEPAKLGAAILHGPHVWNFADIYSALDSAHGAELVADGSRLTAAIAAWLNAPDARKRVADAARTVVEERGGALEATLKSLDPYLMQLRLGQRANHA